MGAPEATLRWYSALLAFETGIDAGDDGEPSQAYSLSAILFQAADGQAWATAEALGRSDDDDMPFVTGWRFVDVLTVHNVFPDDEIRQGTEVYSAFLSHEALDGLRNAFAESSSPIEEATGRRYPE
jgi:hypothetical protein